MYFYEVVKLYNKDICYKNMYEINNLNTQASQCRLGVGVNPLETAIAFQNTIMKQETKYNVEIKFLTDRMIAICL